MTKVYICGDSFAVSDSEYGLCWVDYLGDVNNLAQICASNLLISQQVDCAIREQATFIICLFTSSTRQLIKYKDKVKSISWLSIDSTDLNNTQKKLLKGFAAEFFDLDTAIYENKCIIEHTLYKLELSNIPYLFDQGGFEHSSYGSVKKYFNKYEKYRSQYCLWDYASTRNYRPYYHITNDEIHIKVANYYKEKINEKTLGIW